MPDNAVLRPHLPHAELLPEVAVTVTHAGHGTVVASLAHGVPMVTLPNPAADQPALAAHVAELGTGIALDGETATPADIAPAVLAGESYAAAARRLAKTLVGAPGDRNMADAIERLASHPPAGGEPQRP